MDAKSVHLQAQIERSVNHRSDLMERLSPAATGYAWLVNTFLNQDGTTYFHQVDAELSATINLDELSDLSRAILIRDFLRKEYSSERFPGILRVQNLAFTHFELADLASEYFQGSDLPAQMHLSEITVPVDRFKDEILDGKRPFIVMVDRGSIFEVWGHQSPDYMEVYSYNEISYQPKAKQ
ncbi:hypothetical protein [Dyadobacter sp. CY356]|uniref:hypothetical protein n=1 Tax=Dyadobacter sp. CY356 TaxID=2906442 RepID=UPI001F1B79AC|nr:hypothetical protein [Dyadobacter sp. CY356]MCF0057147.1 hypothetical protein [Dyadobacter sp. CY356]